MTKPSDAQPRVLRYAVNRTTLPDDDDLFSELEEAYEEVLRLRGEIERAFNQSPARTMLHGFIIPGLADLSVRWAGTKAEIVIPLLHEGNK